MYYKTLSLLSLLSLILLVISDKFNITKYIIKIKSYLKRINDLKRKTSNNLNKINMKMTNIKNFKTNIIKYVEKIRKKSPLEKSNPEASVPTTEEILASLQELLLTVPLKCINLPQIIKHLMEEIEKTTLKGKKKTELAINILKNTMAKLPEEEDALILLILMDKGIIKNIINSISDASKGKYKINTLSNIYVDKPEILEKSSLLNLGCITLFNKPYK